MNTSTTMLCKGLSIALLFLTALPAFSQRSEKADRYFDQNQFEDAIKYYTLDLKSKNRKTIDYAMQKLADCYRITGEFEKAEATYKKIVKRKKKDPINYLNYGLSLKSSAKYAEAIVQFEEYIKLRPEDPMGKVFLMSCDSAQLWLDETIGKEVKNVEKINTELSDFSPFIFNTNDLFFSSAGHNSTKALISFDGGGDVDRLDLYSIKVNDIETKENKKNELVNFKEVNTPLHEGPACFSMDGTELYFTKTIKGKRDKETNAILGTLQIFYSKKDSSGKWSTPQSAFTFNSKDYSVGHPSLSADGRTIYYMSDKPGGYGKTDIYYSLKQADGSWGLPINAGSSVNTFGHELFPTIALSGDLYFSSNAHPGMGQLDIFKASFVYGRWTNVHNLKPPINSIANDFGITFDNDPSRGFFSSDRFNGKGAEDIYSFANDVPLKLNLASDFLYFIDKTIFDDITYKLTNTKDSVAKDLVSENGHYFIKLQNNQHYILEASKNGMSYNSIVISYNIDSLSCDARINVRASNKPIAVEGFFFPERSKDNQAENNCSENIILLEEEQGQTLHTYRNEKGYFKFDQALEPQKSYDIRSAAYTHNNFE